MPLRTIQQSHRPRVSDRIMRCHSLIVDNHSQACTFQKRMASSQKDMEPTTRERKRCSGLHAEPKRHTRPAEDHSRIEGARSNSWAECQENNFGIEQRGDFSLDIPFYRIVTNDEPPDELDHLPPTSTPRFEIGAGNPRTSARTQTSVSVTNLKRSRESLELRGSPGK
jgi:hypothetical protein